MSGRGVREVRGARDIRQRAGFEATHLRRLRQIRPPRKRRDPDTASHDSNEGISDRLLFAHDNRAVPCLAPARSIRGPKMRNLVAGFSDVRGLDYEIQCDVDYHMEGDEVASLCRQQGLDGYAIRWTEGIFEIAVCDPARFMSYMAAYECDGSKHFSAGKCKRARGGGHGTKLKHKLSHSGSADKSKRKRSHSKGAETPTRKRKSRTRRSPSAAGGP